MDDVVAGERRRKAVAFPPPPPPSSVSFPALTPRGPGLLSSPSGSILLPSPPTAAAIVLALPASHACTTLLGGAMDGDGEALLVRRSKPKKRPAPAAPHAAQGREFGGGNKFLALWRDYHDLLQETDAKKRRLESANRRKLALLAEVKFLRRKYKFLVKCNSQQPNCQLKGHDRVIQSPVEINEASASADHGVGTAVAPSTSKSTNLDLNEDSITNEEGFDRRGHKGHPKLGDLDQDGVDGDTVTADVKFSVCTKDTHTENSPSSDDKRTTSWRDSSSLQA